MKTYNIFNKSDESSYVITCSKTDIEEVKLYFLGLGYYNKLDLEDLEVSKLPNMDEVYDFLHAWLCRENTQEIDYKIYEKQTMMLALAENEGMANTIIELFKNL